MLHYIQLAPYSSAFISLTDIVKPHKISDHHNVGFAHTYKPMHMRNNKFGRRVFMHLQDFHAHGLKFHSDSCLYNYFCFLHYNQSTIKTQLQRIQHMVSAHSFLFHHQSNIKLGLKFLYH